MADHRQRARVTVQRRAVAAEHPAGRLPLRPDLLHNPESGRGAHQADAGILRKSRDVRQFGSSRRALRQALHTTALNRS